MNHKYLIRLDDACPFMDTKNWQRMEDILDRYGVKPMVGIIPANADPNTMVESENPLFWDKAKAWEKKGWAIALHGYDHCYISDKGMQGLNPMWSRSEFAGVSLEKQREKIRKGVNLLREHGLEARYFFAPSHTFDENTLQALKEETNIRIISDTIGRYPYKIGDFWFIPQITGHCVKMPLNGIYTFCFHPNTMNDAAFNALEVFLQRFDKHFANFNNIKLQNFGDKKIFDKILSNLFFIYRNMK
jgi:predicted deacetylase